MFALYVKTKNFHWHMTRAHFRDYHLLLDEHGEQIFAMTDEIAERARKIGGTTLRSIGDIARHQRLHDSDEELLAPKEMLAELSEDNQQLTRFLRHAQDLRRLQRRRHGQPDRKLDRRNRAADLVPLGNRQRPLIRSVGAATARDSYEPPALRRRFSLASRAPLEDRRHKA